jgi:Oxidoreductase molybdopterin binding domain
VVLSAGVPAVTSSRRRAGVGERLGLAVVLGVGALLSVAPRLSAQDHDHAPAPATPLATSLTIVDPTGATRILTASQLGSLPRHSGRAEVHGHAWTWEGVELRAALRLAGIATDSLRGPALARVLVLVGADGYRATLTLADLDPSLGARRAWLVDREDGVPLTPARLPRRVIVEGDQRASRWVTQLVRIEVVDAARR